MNNGLIDMRAWRQFAVLAQELHFGRAAARLNMTQPPLTLAIAKLEEQLGIRLFERHSRKVALTPAAQMLLPEVEQLLQRGGRLPELARAIAKGEAGELRLAFVSTAGYDVIPRWVRLIRQHLPGLKLRLQEATGNVQLQALAKGELDAGLVLHVPGGLAPGLQAHAVKNETLCLAIPAQHRLALLDGDAEGKIAPVELKGEPLVSIPRHILPSLHDELLRLYQFHHLHFDVVQEAIQMQTLVNLVSAGLGLAWVPESVQAFQREGVVYRHVASTPDCPIPMLECSLVWPQGQQSAALGRLLHLLGCSAPSQPQPESLPPVQA